MIQESKGFDPPGSLPLLHFAGQWRGQDENPNTEPASIDKDRVCQPERGIFLFCFGHLEEACGSNLPISADQKAGPKRSMVRKGKKYMRVPRPVYLSVWKLTKHSELEFADSILERVDLNIKGTMALVTYFSPFFVTARSWYARSKSVCTLTSITKETTFAKHERLTCCNRSYHFRSLTWRISASPQPANVPSNKRQGAMLGLSANPCQLASQL